MWCLISRTFQVPPPRSTRFPYTTLFRSAMMIGPVLSEAWQAMGANRLRTFLTMLGMMIGVGAVIMMLAVGQGAQDLVDRDRKSTRLNSSHRCISYAVFCLKKKIGKRKCE